MAGKGSVNKVILIGNLGADPEIRYMPNGNAVANVSVATSETWKDRNTGESQERTEWHRVVFFGKIADVVGQYLKKGSKIYIEGRLQTRKWQGQDGQDRYTTEVVIDQRGTLQMLDGRPGGGTVEFGDSGSRGGQTQSRSGGYGNDAPASGGRADGGAPQSQPSGKDDFDDDIPF